MKTILIIVLCLFISIRGNETIKDFLNGISEVLGWEPVSQECCSKKFDLVIEEIKSYMAVNNLEAFNENGSNMLLYLLVEFNKCSDIFYSLIDIITLEEDENLYSMLLSNLITIEKLFVKYYKSDSKGGREMGQMIGGIFKIIKDNKKNKPIEE